MNGPCLEDLPGILGELAELQHTLGTVMLPQAAPDRFGIPSEVPIKSRLEVRTGRLLANVCRETESIVGMLREQAPPLGGRGVDEAFLGIVDELIRNLKDAQAKLASAREAHTPAFAVRCSQKSKLYDLARKLVWIGRLECLCRPKQTPDIKSPGQEGISRPFLPSPTIDLLNAAILSPCGDPIRKVRLQAVRTEQAVSERIDHSQGVVSPRGPKAGGLAPRPSAQGGRRW